MLAQEEETLFWRRVVDSANATRSFSQVHASASCCRDNGARVASANNRTKSSCASACLSHARCVTSVTVVQHSGVNCARHATYSQVGLAQSIRLGGW